ncbi:hypothetical protein C2E23DRAFT_882720 [Lenzites betulinus]|nr:hypothetical protein C2E23DRAFT_882720 [Lenzites betulinus]
MSRLPGHNLAGSYTAITPEVEQRLSSQLSRMLAPLRALSPLGPAACGFDQGPIYCQRMAFGAPPLGPFADVHSFHRFLLTRARMNIPPEANTELIQETIKRDHSRSRRLCLTHNDLGPHNILVDDDWNITGIVDWESCAWMPDYWELTKGTFLPQYRSRKGRWTRILTSVFLEYMEELEAERYIVMYRDCYT